MYTNYMLLANYVDLSPERAFEALNPLFGPPGLVLFLPLRDHLESLDQRSLHTKFVEYQVINPHSG